MVVGVVIGVGIVVDVDVVEAKMLSKSQNDNFRLCLRVVWAVLGILGDILGQLGAIPGLSWGHLGVILV